MFYNIIVILIKLHAFVGLNRNNSLELFLNGSTNTLKLELMLKIKMCATNCNTLNNSYLLEPHSCSSECNKMDI